MAPDTIIILVAMLAANLSILGFLWYVHRDLKGDIANLETRLNARFDRFEAKIG